MAEGFQTQREFELPVGLEKNDEIHRKGIMRAAKGGDILAVQSDMEYREFVARFKGSTMSVQVKPGQAADESNIQMDPVAMQEMGALEIMKAAVLMPLLIVSLGTLEKKGTGGLLLSRNDIKNLHEKDINYLMKFKTEMDNQAGVSGEKSDDPLASQT